MPTIIDLPASLRQSTNNFWLASASADVRGLNGRAQVIYAESRYWIGQIELAHVSGPQLLSLRSIGTRLRGRANLLRVPVYNGGTLRARESLADFYADAGIPDAYVALGHIPYSDGASFSDGSGFALPSPDDPVVLSSAEAGASTILLAGYVASNMAIGARFSLNDFLYEVEGNEDGRITFSPPLRARASTGDVASVSCPHILVRLSDPAGWMPYVNEFRQMRTMQIDVEEAFDR